MLDVDEYVTFSDKENSAVPQARMPDTKGFNSWKMHMNNLYKE